MDRRVKGRRNALATLDQLGAALLEEWDNIPMRTITQMKLQPVGGFHPYILRLLNHRPSQSTPVRYPSPDHNRPTTKPIPLKNASVGEVFLSGRDHCAHI
jgi:hypothetical protein